VASPTALSLSRKEHRSVHSVLPILTSLKWRRKWHPTALLIRRKLDELSRPALDSLSFRLAFVDGKTLSPHQLFGISRAVRYYPAETAEEVAHAHHRGEVISTSASNAAYVASSHILRLAIEHIQSARGIGLPLLPIATDRHLRAMSAFQVDGNERAAVEILGLADARVLRDGAFVTSKGLLIGCSLCAMLIRSSQTPPGDICCGSCMRLFKCDEVAICVRCGDHIACNECLAGDGRAQHASECSRVRAHVRSMAQSLGPYVRGSVRRVAVVRLNATLITPMHISNIVSPLIPSSLWEALSGCSSLASHVNVTVHWRLLIAFLAEEDGDEQTASAYEGGNQIYSTLRAAECVANEKLIGSTNKAPKLLPSERRRVQKEREAIERRTQEEGGAAAASVAMAEANAVLERQAARPDATSAMLTSVLAKREGAASPEVVARVRVRRDSLKAAEKRARKPDKARPERKPAERCDGDLTHAWRGAALLLQRHVLAWLRRRKRLRRRQRSFAAKLIQSSVRTWRLLKIVAKPSIAFTAAPSRQESADDEEPEPPEPEPPKILASIEPATAECAICWDADAVYAAVPCGHRCLCAHCSKMVSQCPVCRVQISLVLRVFV